jgi:3-carboxy-cis,cis-muconate cycloisomerase
LRTFEGIFVPADPAELVSDTGWVDGMLEAERALAPAEGRAGVTQPEASAGIAPACRSELFDVRELVAQGRDTANPAEPLVRALRERVGGEAAHYVHWSATSQDIVDKAATLVARAALDPIVARALELYRSQVAREGAR